MSEPAGLHYQLVCYVCGPGCTKPSPFEGWATFAHIFNNRPPGCRFAVARSIPILLTRETESGRSRAVVGEPSGPYVAWDLLDAGVLDRASRAMVLLRPPLPMWKGEASEGLIMKAMALFHKVP